MMMVILIWSGVRAKTLQSPPHTAPYCDWSVLIIIIINIIADVIIIIKDKNNQEKFKPIWISASVQS